VRDVVRGAGFGVRGAGCGEEKLEQREKREMNRQEKHINGKSTEAAGSRAGNGFEDDMQFNREDSALFENISEYMKGRLDLDEVRNDPDMEKTRVAVNEMISDYHKNVSGNKDNEKFIRDVFSKATPDEKINKENGEIKLNTGKIDISNITSEWVKEWHRKKQTGVKDKHEEEISDFINSSLKSEESEPANGLDDFRKKGLKRSRIIRYMSLSAAAVIGLYIVVRTLLPSSGPEKLFETYYKPFDAISPVTRSINSNEAGTYSSAIASYKNRNYLNAASLFSETVLKDQASVPPRFFLGLTQLALKDYNRAIILLTGVVNESGEYVKDAQWYLGLAYLKTGNKTKAAECFENLSRNDGYYRERSEKILRRLK
jgi:TolA-binding protein